MTWTETGIMRRSQPWIWEKGVPGKENSKCKSPEVEMILECSGHRIATMLSDFKEQNKDGEWSRKCSQPSLSTVSLSSWVYSKRITFTEAAFACPTNYPSHLLITLFSKHTLHARQPWQLDSWSISASLFHKALLRLLLPPSSWQSPDFIIMIVCTVWEIFSRHFCICGNTCDPHVSLRRYFNIEWVGKLTQIHAAPRIQGSKPQRALCKTVFQDVKTWTHCPARDRRYYIMSKLLKLSVSQSESWVEKTGKQGTLASL